jgi:type II secretory pathway predicted ATPase ExeA
MNSMERTLAGYARQWGMTGVPFCELGTGGLYQTAAVQQVWQRLEQTAMLRSVMVLCGESGVGKSAVAAAWLRSLDPKQYVGIALTQATLNGSGLLSCLAQKLGQNGGGRRPTLLRRLEETLGPMERMTAVVVLDEAHLCGTEALEEVRLLLGLNLAARPTFAWVLLADPHLLETLRLRAHRALHTRIGCSMTLPPLSRPEVEGYLEHGFVRVGLKRNCVEPAAVELLTAASEGIPRTLNLLTRRAWIEACEKASDVITPEHVHRALQQVPCRTTAPAS